MQAYRLNGGKETTDEESPLVNQGPRDTRDNVVLSKFCVVTSIAILAFLAGLVSLYLFVL